MRAIVCAICLCVSLPVTAQQKPSAAPEQKAIEDSARAFVTAYDAGDAAAIAALWTPDAEYMVGPTTVKGQAAIQKLYEEFLKAHPGSKMELKIDSIQMLAPNVAVEQGTASVSGSTSGPPSASDYMAVHLKQGNKWLMASVRESELPTPPAGYDLKELAWLIGDWQTKGEGGEVDIKYEWIANNNYIRGETTVKAKDAAAASGGTQIIGRDPFTGQLVTWFFHADGGRGNGVWMKSNKHWLIITEGATADGIPTTATNVLYQAADDVMSWCSVNRSIGGQALPDTKEVVIERVAAKEPAAK